MAPSEELQRKFFRGIEEAELKLELNEIPKTKAVSAFLELMKFLRIVILQDSVILNSSDHAGYYGSHSISERRFFYRRKVIWVHIEEMKVCY